MGNNNEHEITALRIVLRNPIDVMAERRLLGHHLYAECDAIPDELMAVLRLISCAPLSAEGERWTSVGIQFFSPGDISGAYWITRNAHYYWDLLLGEGTNVTCE